MSFFDNLRQVSAGTLSESVLQSSAQSADDVTDEDIAMYENDTAFMQTAWLR